MISLVGYTGFVGNNIYASAGNTIDAVYNSKNIEDAYGTNPDLLIYSGLRAEKYLANISPEKDYELVERAENIITKINPKNIVLISTIDVIKNPYDVNEDNCIETQGLHPYGLNRYMLELWVEEHFADALIVRLPALYGKNLKKNFIYDMINYIPFMIKEQKMMELSACDEQLKKYYVLQTNGFYKLNVTSSEERKELKKRFSRLGFSALNFTDSRSIYQFYDLERLWRDINIALENKINILHLATAPISAGEIYKYVTNCDFNNELNGKPAYYNYKTKYCELFGGYEGYIENKEEVLKKIKSYIDEAGMDL